MPDTIDTTLPLIQAQLLGTLGPVNTIDTTLVNSLSGTGASPGPWLIASLVGSGVSNTINTTLPLFQPLLVGAVNLQVGSGLYQINVNRTHDTYYNNVANGTTINAKIPDPTIQTALMHDDAENVIHMASYRIRVTGSGILRGVLYTLDKVRSQSLANLTMTPTIAREPIVLSNFMSQRIMLNLHTENIDEIFDITRI